MPQGLSSIKPLSIGPAPKEAESTKSVEAIKNLLSTLYRGAAEQPVAKIAGAGMDVFDKLYRGNVGTEPVQQGQVQIPASEQKVAGIPFGPKQIVYHGTSKPFEKFNPYYNNPNDLFGKLTHFAEDPAYAGEEYTGLSVIDDLNQYWGKKGEAVPASTRMTEMQPRVIPARLDVKNALDVTSNDPDMINWDDLNKLLKATGEESPIGMSGSRISPTAIKAIPNMMVQSGGKHWKPSYGPPPNKMPRNFVQSILTNNPNALSDAGFDAIRYADNFGASMHYRPEVWAIENPALAKSPYTGESLGLSLKPRNLERIVGQKRYQPSKAITELEAKEKLTDRWRVEGLDNMLRERIANRIRSMGTTKPQNEIVRRLFEKYSPQ